jgi:integrase
MPRASKNRIAAQFFIWNLFKRDGVWYADGRHNEMNVGKHSLGTRDHREAVQAVRELDRRKAFDLGLCKEHRRDGHAEIAIQDGWERYMRHAASPDVLGGAGERTQKRYRAVQDKHQPYCERNGVVSWNRIDKAAVTKYGAWLSKEGYSDATIYLECTLLKQIVKWLIEEEKVLPESQRIRLSLRRSEDSDAHCYSRDQVKAMVEFCRADSKLNWLGDAMVALATTGMRIGELAALRWTDIDLNASVVTLTDNRHSAKAKKAGAVRTTKGRRARRIDIHQDFRALLERLPRRADGKVFGGLNGGPLRPDKVLKVLQRDVIGPLKVKFATPAGEIGFADGCVHSFRHYFVTEAFVGGATEAEIMDWVGHRNSRIVRRYRHLRRKTAQRTMEELDFLGGDRTKPKDAAGRGASGSEAPADGANQASNNDRNRGTGSPGGLDVR